VFSSACYYVFNLLFFGLCIFFFVRGLQQPGYDPGSRITHFCYGLAIAFLLVPLHEYIHVLAYRSQGAKQTSYDARIRKFYFMALADGFVASTKEFRVVAWAPFAVITALCIALLFVVPFNWCVTIAGILLAHTAMCSGDFALLAYLDFYRDREVVTYDDVPGKVSYFFGKPQPDADSSKMSK
jgi:hypothetical protein